MTTTEQHLASILISRGNLKVENRTTPTPGPNELLIDVKSIALNPVDYIQRNMGFHISSYPAIIGSDIAGTVIAVGSSVDDVKVGTRVLAYAPAFMLKGQPNYGAFQKRVLVPSSNVTPLPDHISFNEASIIPLAVETVWTGLVQMGIARDTKWTPADKKGILIWGAGGSIGCAAVQIARSLGYIVYATASAKHHGYLIGLGASKMFDYNDKQVISKIVQSVKDDKVTIGHGFLGAGDLNACVATLSQLKGDGSVKLASAPFTFGIFWWKLFPRWKGVEAKFIVNEEIKTEFFHFIFRVWLKEKLVAKEFVPSPQIEIIAGGLEGIQPGLDKLKKGVSGVKLVVEI